MLSLRNLELLIVMRARFKGAVPVVVGGPWGPAFTLAACIIMSIEETLCPGFSPSSLAKSGTESRERHPKQSYPAIHFGRQPGALTKRARRYHPLSDWAVGTPYGYTNSLLEQPQPSFELLLQIRGRSDLSNLISRSQPFLFTPLTFTPETPLPKLVLSG